MAGYQRAVLEYTQGDEAGMHLILGQLDLLTLGGRPLPEYLVNVTSDVLPRPVEFASLIKVTNSYVLYREAFPTPKGRFNQATSWHPEQR